MGTDDKSCWPEIPIFTAEAPGIIDTQECGRFFAPGDFVRGFDRRFRRDPQQGESRDRELRLERASEFVFSKRPPFSRMAASKVSSASESSSSSEQIFRTFTNISVTFSSTNERDQVNTSMKLESQ
nr:unnamed protein product [Spirometra erinaceieuropaei]